MPARSVSFGILNDIFFQRKTMDEAFARAEGFEELEARDRGLVRLLVSTVLKRARQMDGALEKFLHEPISSLKPQQVINIFRLGIAQLLFLKTPPHAAVNTMVELAEAEGMMHQKSFVNAVLRRVAQEGIPPMDDRDAGRTNTPEWLWQAWMEDYGVETALDIVAANLSESPVDFTVKENPEEWAEKLEATALPTGALRRESAGFVPGLPGFDEGAWWVQNAAAALPVQLLGDLTGKTVVDLCAAPGGKTAQLVAAGAKVIAVDRSAGRIERLKENMLRLGMTVEMVVADGAAWQPSEKVDVVLLDAPCTATGTIRHQPDVLWLKDIRDQEKLAALQRRLMVNALEMLKPGGELIYCTCSLQKAEGEDQTDWFLAQNLPVVLKKIEMKNISEMITERGEIRALPSHWRDFNGIDGFYVARFARE
jgi:16S rRNA (cytosine967-C5)-methyltransferase